MKEKESKKDNLKNLFEELDWPALFRDEETSGLARLLPYVTIFLLIVILIVILTK